MATRANTEAHPPQTAEKTPACLSSDDPAHDPEAPPQKAYSLFTKTQKGWIMFIGAWAGWFSTASSFIYFPAIPFLADDMNVSVQAINLTVTSYMIASGIFPTIVGQVADKYGRRITLMACLSVYVVVNVGLAVQRSYAALFVLRMLQSAAISGGYSIAYGLIGDLTTPAERGGFTGTISVFLNTPPSIAPMISGLLLIRWPWPSIFWFTAAASALALLATALFVPETCRAVVGDGSISTPPWNTPLVPLLRPRMHEGSETKRGARPSYSILNILENLKLLKDPGTLCISVCFGIYYMIQTCTSASLSSIFVDTYHVSGLVAGLIYMPFGLGCMVASYIVGQVVNRDYKITARKHGLVVDRVKGDDLSVFPIERARLRSSKYFIVICVPLLIAYGWTLEKKLHMAVPLVLQFLFGFNNQFLYTSLNTLLVDYWPTQSAAAQAANNLVRCELSAVGLAVLDIMIGRLGVGWCFVVFAVLHALTLPVLLLLEWKGLGWRQASLLKSEQ